MEYTTIIGIVIAVIIMLFGVRMIFRKPADAAPSLESALHIDADSQKPIIPRHVRDQ
ncbi:MAG: cell division protein ZipA, partial [Acinetobacter sp.]|nr:cell division protein ZipA [Acinetobacter sp.]